MARQQEAMGKDPLYQKTKERFFAVLLVLNLVFFLLILVLEVRAHLISKHETPIDVSVENVEQDARLHEVAKFVVSTYREGRQAFVKCALCHSIEAHVPNFGPELTCVQNRRIAESSDVNYRYSEALLEMRITKDTWDLNSLVQFIKNPEAFVASTGKKSRMPFPGIKDNARQLRSIVAYLHWTCVKLDPVAFARIQGNGCSPMTLEEVRNEAMLHSISVRDYLESNTDIYALPESVEACRP